MPSLRKKILPVLLAIILTLFCALTFSACQPASSPAPSGSSSGSSSSQSALADKLVILHTNDTHGYDNPEEPGSSSPGIIGMAAVAQLKKDYQAQGYQVLLLSAGDDTQDNVLVNDSQGSAAIDFMNSAGYDAMAIGNHEFDWGTDNLQNLIDKADFPVLAANITVQATGQPLVKPNTVFTLAAGTKVGVFGLTTPESQTKASPKATYGLHFGAEAELYAEAQQQVDELKAQGCDLIVALGHLGSIEGTPPNRSIDVLENTTGIDIFIDGHDHQVVNELVNGGLLVSTGCHLENIGAVFCEDGELAEKMVTYGSYSGSDPSTQAIIDAAEAEIDAKLATVIGNSEVDLDGNRNPGTRTQETNLGDFVTDALLWQAQQASDATIDGAIVNGGGIRASISSGSISMKTLNTVFPYNNSLTVVTLTGAQLLEALEASTFCLPEEAGGFPQVSGITYSVDTSVPYVNGDAYPNSTYYGPANPGARVTITDVGGKGFQLDGSYNIAASSFITDGGDTYYAVAAAYQANGYSIGYTDTNSLINYLQTALGGAIGQDYVQPKGFVTIK